MNYNEAVKYVCDIPKFGVTVDGRNKSGNDNLSYVMEKLGNPHQKIKSIHIAGTNGKGSTAQFVSGILNASGYKTGIFTSPHLVKINERIAINYIDREESILIKDMISDDDFTECFNKVLHAVEESVKEEKMHLSFFEFVFAMAAVYFAEKKPDYVIYETGLGGRLDATNIINPEITAITSIGFDHTAYLGNTIEEIAGEKAGIIKANVPVVFNTGDIDADYVIERVATKLQAEAINVAKNRYIINEITDKTIDFSIHNSYYKYDNLIINTKASYQVDNATTAVVLCNKLLQKKEGIDENIVREGLELFSWPGRMERIHDNVILDGAHNVDAINRFIESVELGYTESGKINLLFAVAGDKDYEPMIQLLCEKLPLNKVYITSINSMRGISSEYIAALFKLYLSKNREQGSYSVESNDDIKAIYEQAYGAVKYTQDMLFCVGSLYLIGSIKEIDKG
ncbi:MAG: bifunctional folylpolyglutamate synthase/dihydrofolate synthase [Lachnospiraceae bacterium]|nr:bifunctional folylpolyglutamate synthase/dihydrofolate synthase [Lachnospiraceae bacterium]